MLIWTVINSHLLERFTPHSNWYLQYEWVHSNIKRIFTKKDLYHQNQFFTFSIKNSWLETFCCVNMVLCSEALNEFGSHAWLLGHQDNIPYLTIWACQGGCSNCGLSIELQSYTFSFFFPSALFSVMCYNVLCDKYATRQLYGYCPSWALNWEYRKKAIMQEILSCNADIISLQVIITLSPVEW